MHSGGRYSFSSKPLICLDIAPANAAGLVKSVIRFVAYTEA